MFASYTFVSECKIFAISIDDKNVIEKKNIYIERKLFNF